MKPTKNDIIDALQRLANARVDSRVSIPKFEDDTGWSSYWFDRFWPESGYRGACEEAGVQPGLLIGVDVNTRLTDDEVARRLADAIEQNRMRFPSLDRFKALSRIGVRTICRGEKYETAKRRLINEYLSLAADQRKESVENVMLDELRRLENSSHVQSPASLPSSAINSRFSIKVPLEFVSTVREFRDRGEEEQRQLAARFFVEVLGYHRSRVRSEHERNDVRVYDRRDAPWLVIEVKPSLDSDRHKKSARRQGFDYAHRVGVRFVVISDGDYYEVYDRCHGERLAYDEMMQGNFRLTSLRSRDDDLLSLLASEH